MNELKNLEEILDILMKQEEMVTLMEEIQEEKETVETENLRLKKQLEESMRLNDQLELQNLRLQRQINELLKYKQR